MHYFRTKGHNQCAYGLCSLLVKWPRENDCASKQQAHYKFEKGRANEQNNRAKRHTQYDERQDKFSI